MLLTLQLAELTLLPIPSPPILSLPWVLICITPAPLSNLISRYVIALFNSRTGFNNKPRIYFESYIPNSWWALKISRPSVVKKVRVVRVGTMLSKFVFTNYSSHWLLLSRRGSCEAMEWTRDDENGARCLDEEVNILTLIS